MNCLYSFRTRSNFKLHENACNNHGYCQIIIPEKDNHILKYNQDQKSLKIQFVIHTNKESLTEMIHG